jgi:outer membrane biosynthesis protein TonB
MLSFTDGTNDLFSAPTYNADADVPMTEADLSPLLSKPTPTKEEKKKKKKGKKEDKEEPKKESKKRGRKELEEEEDETDEKVVKQTKSNGIAESAAAKKEKAKIAKNHVSSLLRFSVHRSDSIGRKEEEETEDCRG